jgi:hypothetical protein
MKKLNFPLSIAAGLLGGLLSHYVWTQPVHAQSMESAPKEVRSQSFVLVDGKGVVQGVFSVDKSADGSAIIKLLNGEGREIWKAGANPIQLIGASTTPK